jgi:hypothetical protein
MRYAILAAALLAGLGSGCVHVDATPDRPIEINLNINIRQEVVFRLEDEARDLLRENPDLF